MRSESALQAYLVKEARRRGILSYKWESPGRRGVPDLILICPGGHVCFIEVKSPSGRGRLSELQLREHERLRAKGVDVYVIDDREIGLELLDILAAGQ